MREIREILFRGKCCTTGEWVEVFLGIEVLDDYVIQQFSFDEYFASECIDQYSVKLETVGQYTGLTDKNGKKIFEGDILEGDLEDSLDPGAKWRSEIIWGKFGWNCKGNKISLPMDEYDIREGEVIGNIHDNPELLEVKQ
jgi:hypothetical protein